MCPGCGQYADDRAIEDGAVVCSCGHRQVIRLLPLFLVMGPSGAGKSTLTYLLARTVPQVVTLDADILWGPDMDTPEDGYRRFKMTWLRMVMNVHQSGRPVLSLGSSTSAAFELLPLRPYVGPIHTLGLVCDGNVLAGRLRARPTWRGVTEDGIAAMLGWQDQIRQQTDFPILDTTNQSPEETAQAIRAWVLDRL